MFVHIAALLSLGLAVLVSDASAHEYTTGSISIVHPWAPQSPAGAQSGAAYMTVVNSGAKVLRLVKLSSPLAQRIEVHKMTVDKGVMRMRPVEGALDVPAKSRLKLNQPNHHLMLIGLKRPLEEEELVPMTLHFEGGATMEIELYVEAVRVETGRHNH